MRRLSSDFGLLRDNSGSGITPARDACVKVQSQVGLLLRWAVTGHTVGGEDRFDVAGVIDRLRGDGRSGN